MANLDNRTKPTHQARAWRAMIAPYRQPKLGSSLWQLANSFIPFILLGYLMYLTLAYSYLLTLALAPLAAGFQLRIFIIFHDCGHQSFFKSKKANDLLGSLCGLVCYTPYYHWRYFHAIHHATVGNLGQRVEGELLPLTIKKYTQNNGDVLTLTVKEYEQLSHWEKLIYRIYRNPFLLLLIVPLLLFVVLNRFANPRAAKRERHSVYWTNLALLGMTLLAGFSIGFIPWLVIELPILFCSTTIGVWLFYIQHQFQASYWEQGAKWSFMVASLRGSSYYKLPGLLQWFTGNIGYHHIHHLSPLIPNYNLQKCHEASALFRQTETVTFGRGLKSLFLRLWDEEQQIMVGFKATKHKVLQD
jgi:omega-6 fatty acid desaturase (delta-12 desaturase)